MCKMQRKYSLYLIFLILIISPLYSKSIRLKTPLKDFEWSIDFTLGIQNNLISKENGSNENVSEVLKTSGVLFHSYYKNHLFSKSQLNLGFTEIPRFLWTEKPNFFNDELSLNKNLKTVEFDYQFYLPNFIDFLPFCGFTFVSINDDHIYKDEPFNYFSLTAGAQYFRRINRYFTHTYYISYSPMMIINNFKYEHTIHYVNYGVEVMTNTYPISINLFIVFRKLYEGFDQALTFIANRDYKINTAEIGFSFKTNLD